MDTITEAYNMGMKHFGEKIWDVAGLLHFIDQRGYTCDDLQRIMVGIEGIKGSDYEDTRTDDFDTYDAQRDAELE